MNPDQSWAVLGANGSGKSTLLKIIGGLEWPSAGWEEQMLQSKIISDQYEWPPQVHERSTRYFSF